MNNNYKSITDTFNLVNVANIKNIEEFDKINKLFNNYKNTEQKLTINNENDKISNCPKKRTLNI